MKAHFWHRRPAEQKAQGAGSRHGNDTSVMRLSTPFPAEIAQTSSASIRQMIEQIPDEENAHLLEETTHAETASSTAGCQIPLAMLRSRRLSNSSSSIVPVPQPSIHKSIEAPSNCTASKPLVFRFWIWEMLAFLLATVILGCIFVILTFQHGKLQRDWQFSLTLNSLMNILSTIFRGLVATVAAELICQAKWTWFWSYTSKTSARTLIDLQHFDTGSRGALGAIRLIRLVKLYSLPTTIAILIITSSFAISTFVQQAINIEERSLRGSSGSASLPIAQNVSITEDYFGNNRVLHWIKSDAQGPFYAAAFGTNESLASAIRCPGGTCEFTPFNADTLPGLQSTGGNATHATAGICNFCTDLSRYVSQQNEFWRLPGIYTTVYATRFQLHTPAMDLQTGSLLWAESFLSSEALGLARLALANVTILSSNFYKPSGVEYIGMTLSSPNALSCSLYLCLQSYSATILEGSRREAPVSRTPMYPEIHPESKSPFDALPFKGDHYGINKGASFSAVQTPCRVDGKVITADSMAEGPNSTTIWYGHTRGLQEQPARVPKGCLYSVEADVANALHMVMDNLLNASCVFRSNDIPKTINCDNKEWVSGYWMQGNATTGKIIARFDEFAAAITNYFRLGFGRADGSVFEVEGREVQQVSYFVIRRDWLVFPAMLLLLEGIILTWMIARSWRRQETEAAWKSGVLPMIYYQHHFREVDADIGTTHEGRLMTTKEMEADAKHVKVNFGRRPSREEST